MDLRSIPSLACICLAVAVVGGCQHDPPAPASPMPSGSAEEPASPEPTPDAPASDKPAAGSAPNPALPAAPSQCTADSDCRLFDDNCEACRCQVLAAGAPDPVCHVTHVECFVAPCRGKRAICRMGQCSAFDQANGEM